jgi:U3 small nucleolar RNA-associated protein 4
MDVHRCRFVPYPASAINALAFSHPSSGGKQRNDVPIRLAIGRANGNIELWNPLNGIWHQEAIIHGGKDRSVDGLVWTCERDEQASDGKVIAGRLRLFSIGFTTSVTEWDLDTLRAKRHASGQHGDIWCLGVQPLAQTPKGGAGSQSQKLVAGTIDGCLALYSIEDDDLQLQRVVVKSPSKKTRMISIAFQSRHVAIVGCSDSSIRAYDVRNGAILRKMTLGSDLVGGAKEIIAWTIKCLPNGDIVSGDSTGQVCIWDGKTYTLAQRIQSHEQDVLSLATSVDGSSIVSGGMDRRTVLYRPISGASGRWAKASHRRYHKHDVKAMASFEGEGLSIIVSGGTDLFALTPMRRFAEQPRQVPMLAQSLLLCKRPV